MRGSADFARIRRDLLGLVEQIPPGSVTTYAVIGRELDVMARHVAYILAMLDDAEMETTPWFRVVGEGGQLKSTKRRSATTQRELLANDQVQVSDDNQVLDFAQRLYEFPE